ncbi:HoxN/HupN/NixA family nickel/cobalt transporter [Klebsiella pneumoniae]|uniref:Nickel/cobalt efflux system n=1 Tax=Klebsiella pneumoniae TaxID=573 RepID=A0A2X1QGU1_KLEPN|nr:HoxN/HupN/NixA family nickel/cobalt transporter [Klebsiella pneumoniae]
MYLVGFLFGLGFDTATEIGVLGISAAGASSGISVWSIMGLSGRCSPAVWRWWIRLIMC